MLSQIYQIEYFQILKDAPGGESENEDEVFVDESPWKILRVSHYYSLKVLSLSDLN